MSQFTIRVPAAPEGDADRRDDPLRVTFVSNAIIPRAPLPDGVGTEGDGVFDVDEIGARNTRTFTKIGSSPSWSHQRSGAGDRDGDDYRDEPAADGNRNSDTIERSTAARGDTDGDRHPPNGTIAARMGRTGNGTFDSSTTTGTIMFTYAAGNLQRGVPRD